MRTSVLRALLLVWGGISSVAAVAMICTAVGVGVVGTATLALVTGVLLGAAFEVYERRIREEERAKAGRRSVAFELPADVTGEIRGISLLLDPHFEESDAGLPNQEVH